MYNIIPKNDFMLLFFCFVCLDTFRGIESVDRAAMKSSRHITQKIFYRVFSEGDELISFSRENLQVVFFVPKIFLKILFFLLQEMLSTDVSTVITVGGRIPASIQQPFFFGWRS